MRNFEKYFAVTLIMLIVFLANTVSATVHPTAQIGTKTTQNFPADNDFLTNPTPAKSIFDSHSEKVINQKSENFFPNFWEFNNFSKDMIKEIGEFASVDDDSMELVIGVNKVYPDAYNSIVDIVDRFGGKVVNTISIRGEIIAITADMPLDFVSLFRKEVQKTNLVQYLEPNMKFQAQFVPNDSYWNLQWGPQKIEADYAWNTTIGNHNILVAVIDTGIDYTHPDLAANYVPSGYDWVNYDNDPMDDYGHGTHCAGIIAAVLDNSAGIAGVSQVCIMSEKVLDSAGMGTEDQVAKGIIHAVDQGANIISMSIGAYGVGELFHDVIRYAYEHGILLIAAAGNNNINRKLFPAGYDEVVAVAATDQNDNRAWFSNWGEWIEVAAPGVDIYSTVPGSYESHSGTSMACPHVSGVAALIWSQFPNASRDWVRAQLRVTSDDLGDIGFDKYYGYGRINARKAVEQAPPDHDLLIFDCKKPEHFQPERTASFEVSVLNFGINEEENVTVQFFLNESLAGSASIDRLSNGTLGTVGFLWTPLAEGTYNVTFYAIPVSGEVSDANNVLTQMISVRIPVGLVLFDGTRCVDISAFSVWVENLTSRGYVVESYDAGTITLDSLMRYNVLVLPMPYTNYSPDELAAIQDFVLSGGGLLVLGSHHVAFTSFAGISWGETSYYWPGYISDITPHKVTEGVSEVYFSFNEHQLFVTSPAVDLIRCDDGNSEIMLAVSEVGAGRVIALSSVNTITDSYVYYANNLRLANNMVDWLLRPKCEHDLSVSLNADLDIEPGENVLLNATVYNLGSNNETNVELQLLINNTIIGTVTIPELENGASHTINCPWTTPIMVATFNITAYAPILSSENVTINNVKTRPVSVHYPLICPVDGQFAYYLLKYYNASGYLQWTLFNNYTFEYVAPHKVKVTVQYDDPYGNNFTTCMIVNTMNRFVETGDWIGMWFPLWIETNIDIGSKVNVAHAVAEVKGNALFKRVIDCWELPYTIDSYNYTQLHDKTSGLMMDTILVEPFGKSIDMFLADTNILIGSGVTDLAVVGLMPSKTIVAQSYSAYFDITVEDQGVYPKTSNLTIYINSTVLVSQALYLDIGDSANFTFTWNTTSFTKGNYNITAHITPVSNETETADNTVTCWVTVTIPGDVTSTAPGIPDGKVDMRDIGAMCGRFMTTPSSPNWDPNIDVNGDETVNMRDLGIACSNFMKT